MEVFAENPLTGIGAGQFQNYDGAGVVERWRVTHNVWLQVAAELGMFGLLTFLFLVVRAYTASFAVLRMLRRPGNRLRQGVGGQDRVRQGLGGQLRVRSPDRGRRSPQSANGELDLTEAERVILNTNAKGMLAAMVGWTVCSFFASVAFNWTFYYVFALAVAGREIAAKHRAMPGTEQSPATVPRLVRVHA
jgi:hypothetical protein